VGVFDGVGDARLPALSAGISAALVSVGSLLLIVAVLFAWMSECAAVWIPVIRGSLRRVGVVASLVGLLAFDLASRKPWSPRAWPLPQAPGCPASPAGCGPPRKWTG
jgi:hypothetical protein